MRQDIISKFMAQNTNRINYFYLVILSTDEYISRPTHIFLLSDAKVCNFSTHYPNLKGIEVEHSYLQINSVNFTLTFKQNTKCELII